MHLAGRGSFYAAASPSAVRVVIFRVSEADFQLSHIPRQTGRGLAKRFIGHSKFHFCLCSETAAAGGLQLHLVQLAEPEMHLVRAAEPRQDEVLALLHREGTLWTVSDFEQSTLKEKKLAPHYKFRVRTTKS